MNNFWNLWYVHLSHSILSFAFILHITLVVGLGLGDSLLFLCLSTLFSSSSSFLQIQILFTHQCKIYYMINTRKCIPYCIPKNIFQLICVTRLTAWRMWRDIIITTKTTIRLEWRRSQIFCAHLLFSHSTIYPCIYNALMHICTSQDNRTF